MRGSLQFLAVVVIVFFGVGELLGGWYVGLAPQTPLLVYKNTHTTVVTRRVLTEGAFTFGLEGQVRDGAVTLEGIYERPASYQNPGQATLPPRRLFGKRFGPGEEVDVQETLKAGAGVYRVRVTFEEATGVFRVRVLPASGL